MQFWVPSIFSVWTCTPSALTHFFYHWYWSCNTYFWWQRDSCEKEPTRDGRACTWNVFWAFWWPPCIEFYTGSRTDCCASGKQFEIDRMQPSTSRSYLETGRARFSILRWSLPLPNCTATDIGLYLIILFFRSFA